MLNCFKQVNNILLSSTSPIGYIDHSSSSNELNLSNIFRNKPFYFEVDKHNEIDCCFNHLIGLPLKNDKEYPLFDYEKLIFDSIEENQHVWIKKSRGIGATELILRYLAWKSLSSNILNNKSIFLVSGTREEFANSIKIRLERLFERKFPNIKFDSKYTELTLGNNTWVKVFPTKRIQDLRGYTDVSYIFIDEADFFDPAEQTELEYVIKAYEEKSNCKIILTSTPNKPDSLFHKIERNEIFNGFFKKLFLDYTLGLGKIYDSDFIEREKNEPYFQREYCLAYAGLPGNLFSQSEIDRSIERSKNYSIDPINQLTPKYITIDIGFSSSKTAILAAEWLRSEKIINIVHAEMLEKPNYEELVDHVFRLTKILGNVQNIGIDSSAPDFIGSVKRKLGEPYNWQFIQNKILEFKKRNLDIAHYMTVCPIVFNTENINYMASHSKKLLDLGYIAINPKFSNLITALRGAQFNEYKFLKEDSPSDDLTDTFLMLCGGITFFKFKSTGDY
jgi:hypothetical protein